MTTIDPPPSFDAATPHARAAALAGWLAERGVRSLILRDASGERCLTTRDIDLPGELLRAAPCTLLAPALGLSFAVTPDAITPA